ncbi:hypothetical protein BCR34DRAFT_573961 [Clohesyomyces aquaticus]|uniref:F-box domain-containing protein n=1 Tax=Clohesyomyces aquaticus TaxID=1231657 RepID=A0A1Y1YYT4_9PLEO|nr:hypothetical protein BCR34DRAFT_573961 [Clohesyomyces aquaticus]
MGPAALPLEVWLLVFAHIEDANLLWSTCRGVSRFLRDCVDDFFRRGILRNNTLIDLHYSDFHTRIGPGNGYVHIPMVFDRVADDGRLAVFSQRAYQPIRRIECCHIRGSVRGWVPFVERHCLEMRQAPPIVLGKSPPSQQPPLWETEHARLRNRLTGDAKKAYLLDLRNYTSIGRGDRAPYYIKIFNVVNDTELVGLVVDCQAREVSFDWRKTCAAFFREQEFGTRARNHSYKVERGNRWYLPPLVFSSFDIRDSDRVRARRKRLAPWLAENKQRMSPEIRTWTEQLVSIEKERLRAVLDMKNLQPVPEDAGEDDEVVPERLAEDHLDLLFWPWSDDDHFFVKKPWKPKGCVMQ